MDSSLHELYHEGSRLFEEGNYEKAEPLLKKVLMKNPNYPDILNKLGVICNLRGDLEQARDYFKKAVHHLW